MGPTFTGSVSREAVCFKILYSERQTLATPPSGEHSRPYSYIALQKERPPERYPAINPALFSMFFYQNILFVFFTQTKGIVEKK